MKKLFYYVLSFSLFIFVPVFTVFAAEDTIRIYPHVSDGYTRTNDSDGFLSWSDARDYVGSFFSSDPSISDPQIWARSDNGSGFYRFLRPSLSFDTSSIPSDATIQNVSLNVYGVINHNNTVAVVTAHTRSSETDLTNNDWYITNYDTENEFARYSIVANQYNKIYLNQFGINYVNTKGYTVLGLLTENDFDDDFSGTNVVTSFAFNSVDAPGTSTDPYLEVTYFVEDEPETLGELLTDLVALVEAGDFDKWQKNAYMAHLQSVEAMYDNGQYEAASNQIERFIRKVLQDVERENITTEEGGELLEIAQQIMGIIETEANTTGNTGGVPLMTQIASPYPPESADWASELYADGRAQYPGSCGATISACGCALASFAMLGQSYGLLQGVDGSEATPPNINAWLLANNGYDAVGNIKWREAIKYFGKKRNGTIQSYLTLDADHETDRSVIESYLSEQYPVITKTRASNRDGTQFTHFIVSHGLIGDTYAVRDPLWYNTENLDDTRDRMPWVQDYNDFLYGGRLFTYRDVPETVARGINVQIASPAEMIVTDEVGRKLGYDPVEHISYDSIPRGVYYHENAFYSEELSESGEVPHITKTLDISDPEGDTFTLEVIGTDDGEYYIAMHVVGDDGEGELIERWVDTTRGQRDVYTITVPAGDPNAGHGNDSDQCDEDNRGEGGSCA